MSTFSWVADVRALKHQQPWSWPRAYQYASWGIAVCVGLLLGAPWLGQGAQAWSEAVALETQLQDQRQSTQRLRQQTTQMQALQAAPWPAAMDARALSTLPGAHGLAFSRLSVAPSLQMPALSAMQLQQRPIQLDFNGSWDGLMRWWSAWPQAAMGVTVSTLTIKAHPQGGIEAQLLVLAPQQASPSESERSTSDLRLASGDPFDAQQWRDIQRAHAEKHPSYAVRVVPELLRKREPLEGFPRDQLHYVGTIAARGEVQALLRVVSPDVMAPVEPMTSIHRVRVGEHMGHDFGRLVHIAPDHLLVQELVLEPRGDWVHRHMRLELQARTP